LLTFYLAYLLFFSLTLCLLCILRSFPTCLMADRTFFLAYIMTFFERYIF
jgi:hypothetical protein